MREISCQLIQNTVRDMCIQATHFLSEDMSAAMNQAIETEKSQLGKIINIEVFR